MEREGEGQMCYMYTDESGYELAEAREYKNVCTDAMHDEDERDMKTRKTYWFVNQGLARRSREC